MSFFGSMGSALNSVGCWLGDKALSYVGEPAAWLYDWAGLPGAPNVLATVQSIHEALNLWDGKENVTQFAEHETRIIATKWLTDEFESWGIPSWLAVPLVALLGPIMDKIIDAGVDFIEGLTKKEFGPKTQSAADQLVKDDAGKDHTVTQDGVTPPLPTPNAPVHQITR